MRILVTGSRHTTPADAQLVRQTLDTYLPFAPLTVVHGACPYGGVDLNADQWAVQSPYTVAERHSADWDRLGKAAGMARNTYMVQLGADLCLGFPGPGSRGTWDCLKKAVDAGIPTRVSSLQGGEISLCARCGKPIHLERAQRGCSTCGYDNGGGA